MTTTPHIDTHLDLPGLKAMQDYLAKKLPEALLEIAVRELTITVAADNIPATIKLLRDDKKLQFTQLTDICGVDYLGAKQPHPARFAVVYHLLSMPHNQRIRVKTYLGEAIPNNIAEGNPNAQRPTPNALSVPTITHLHPAAGWYERETYDMYGINFVGHPDLRRLLTDYDFVGHPLRKDFPLEGFVEVYYDAKEKRVAYKPVDLPQELRHFDRVSEWKGITGNTGLAAEDNTFGDSTFNAQEFK